MVKRIDRICVLVRALALVLILGACSHLAIAQAAAPAKSDADRLAALTTVGDSYSISLRFGDNPRTGSRSVLNCRCPASEVRRIQRRTQKISRPLKIKS